MLIRIYTWTERINYIHLRIFFKERKIKEKDSMYSIECVCVCARMHIYVCVYECACIWMCMYMHERKKERKKETEPKGICLGNFFLCTNIFFIKHWSFKSFLHSFRSLTRPGTYRLVSPHISLLLPELVYDIFQCGGCDD